MDNLDYALTERESQEVEFAKKYFNDFQHGTNGHISYTVIAKLFRQIEMLLNDENEVE